MENAKKELEKYLSPNIAGLIAGAVLIVLGFFFTFVFANPLGLLLFAFMAVLCSFSTCIQLLSMKKALDSAEKDNTLPELLQDFKCGSPLINDSIRIGEKYIIGRGCVVPTKFDEIKQIYEFIHKTNFVVDSHMIKAITTKNEERILCRLPLRNVSDEEVYQIILLVKSKNNAVIIGYK